MAAEIIQTISSDFKDLDDQIEKHLNFIQIKFDGSYQKKVSKKHAWFIGNVQNQISESESLTDKIIITTLLLMNMKCSKNNWDFV